MDLSPKLELCPRIACGLQTMAIGVSGDGGWIPTSRVASIPSVSLYECDVKFIVMSALLLYNTWRHVLYCYKSCFSHHNSFAKTRRKQRERNVTWKSAQMCRTVVQHCIAAITIHGLAKIIIRSWKLMHMILALKTRMSWLSSFRWC